MYGVRVPLPARLRLSGYGAPYVSGGQGDFLRLTTEMDGIHSDPVGNAKLIELTGFFDPDVKETCLNCFKGVFADGIPVDLGGHEPGNDFVIRLTGVRPEFRERFLCLLPDPDGDGLHE